MKIKHYAVAIAGIALVAAQSAYAAPVTYRAAGNHNFTGSMNAVVGGVAMTCATTITVNVPEANVDSPPLTGSFAHALPTDNSHGHSMTMTNMVLTGGPLGACALAKFHGPAPVTYNNGTLTMTGVVVDGPFGVTCSGNINAPATVTHGNATTNGSTSITFSSASLGPCTFSGTLTANGLDVDAGEGHKWP